MCDFFLFLFWCAIAFARTHKTKSIMIFGEHNNIYSIQSILSSPFALNQNHTNTTNHSILYTVWVCASNCFDTRKLLRFVWQQSDSRLTHTRPRFLFRLYSLFLKATKSHNPSVVPSQKNVEERKYLCMYEINPYASCRIAFMYVCCLLLPHRHKWERMSEYWCAVCVDPIMEIVFIFGIVLKITSFIEHEMHTFHINLAHTIQPSSQSSSLWL